MSYLENTFICLEVFVAFKMNFVYYVLLFIYFFKFYFLNREKPLFFE